MYSHSPCPTSLHLLRPRTGYYVTFPQPNRPLLTQHNALRVCLLLSGWLTAQEALLNGNGQVILMGDFNARTSILQDYVLDDATLPPDCYLNLTVNLTITRY